MEKLIPHLAKFARIHYPKPFPREWGLKRTIVADEKHFYTLVKLARLNKLDGFLSVYSPFEYENHLLATLFFDLDVSQPDEFEELAVGLSDLYPILLKLPSRVYFSGKKGYHVFIDFPLIPIEGDKLRDVAEFVMFEFLEGDKLEPFIDTHVLGDWRRISRVPFTYRDNGRIVEPIMYGKTNPFIYEALVRKVEDIALRNGRNEEVKIVEEPPKLPMLPDELVPECIKHIIDQIALTGEMSHEGRFHLVAFLSRIGISPESIEEIFKYAGDYNPKYTRYQINHISRNKYLVLRCKRVRELKLCPFKNPRKCPFYPSINRAMGWIVDGE